MVCSANAELNAKGRLTCQSSLRLMVLCSVLGVTALLPACGGDGGDNSVATTPPVVVDKYPNVPTPTVTALPSSGVSADRDYPFLASDFDPKAFGFVEEEFLFDGKANVYDLKTSRTDVFSLANNYPVTQNAKVVSTGNPYRTRMIVLRPSDPAKFNGTVIVEWVNASNTWDTPIHLFEQKNMVLRKGYAYVGVTVQDMTISGTNGLKAWSPKRYGTLDVTNGGKLVNEELSLDIFSQAAKAVRADSKVMGGMSVKKVLAVGESQSAMRLGVYLNSVHPLTGNIFDGALVTNSGPAQRTDLSIPIIKILTESEFETATTNETMVLQSDTDKYKTWYVAGSTHSNLTSLLPRTVMYVRDFNGKMISDTCAVPMNSRVNLGHIYNAGIVALEKYIDKGTAMPTSPQFQYTASATAPSLMRDADGLALGGIRVPDVVVPVALNSGVNTACPGLSGSHVPFTKAKLDALYSTHADYVSKVTTAANQSVADGFMLAEDAQDVINTASASIHGYKLNCDGDGTTNLCGDRGLFPQTPSIHNLRWHIYLYYLPNRAKILAPVDEAALKIASGYNATDAATKKMYFSQAIALLENYSDLIQAEATGGTLSKDSATYLSGQASQLITELQKL
ncbi:alpha/beta hydrolase domain-containing protein [Propionivibrio limicola]|uniref:alpha/beta hydrolase domain-containing protein n=1 Tax=Propionivibrio limicola TaxID=167645 RepID=UPI0012928166|nr:alpha/beta hydrolase domain-containing protein [Propionivibrio limicola]